jgi:hypothetical protein
MLMFLEPSNDQIGIITSATNRLQVHHRDGVRFNNDFTNLQIVTPQQNVTMAHGILVFAFYDNSGSYYKSFDSKIQAAEYFGKNPITFDYYLNSSTTPPHERQRIKKNEITFFLIN